MNLQTKKQKPWGLSNPTIYLAIFSSLYCSGLCACSDIHSEIYGMPFLKELHYCHQCFFWSHYVHWPTFQLLDRVFIIFSPSNGLNMSIRMSSLMFQPPSAPSNPNLGLWANLCGQKCYFKPILAIFGCHRAKFGTFWVWQRVQTGLYRCLHLCSNLVPPLPTQNKPSELICVVTHSNPL